MKKALVILMALFIHTVFAQTNTFPASGNVGIGTLTPSSLLHVNGNAVFGSPADNTYNKLSILGPGTTLGPASKRDISFEFQGAGSAAIRAYRGYHWDTHLQFMTNNESNNTLIERMHIDGYGNVGIGTTAPLTRLHVSGDILGHQRLGFQDNSSFTVSSINIPSLTIPSFSMPHYGVGAPATGGAAEFWMSGLLGIRMFTGGNPVPAFNLINGNLGIGTLTPSSLLHVNGNVALGNSADNTYSKLSILGPGNTLGPASKRDISFEFQGAGSAVVRAYRGSHWDTHLQFLTNSESNNTLVERMHIDGYGNVGIGTTSPAYKLEVKGTLRGSKAYFSGQTTGPDHGGSLEVREINEVANSQSSDDYAPRIVFHWAMKALKSIALGNNGNFRFNNQGSITSFAGIEVGDIVSYGNVGINTTTIPGYKLAVDGNVIAEKIVVKNSTNWPDYVFKRGYSLPGLAEVEKFINQHSHLPEIPSAKEIETNGQDLGEMNKLLLKKVEELTLYLIEQSNKMKTLEAEINKLKERK